MRWFLFLLLTCIYKYAEGQTAVVSAEEMDVFYVGLDNPIKVAIPGVSPRRTVVKISEGTLLKKDSTFLVQIPTRRVNECYVSVGKLKRKDTIWLYTKKFKVRNVPVPKLWIGPIDMQSKTKLLVFKSQIAMAAVLENFTYDGVKFKIVSYKAHIIDPHSGYHVLNVKGNSTAPFHMIGRDLSNAGIIIFDSVLVAGHQTMYLAPAVCRFEESANYQFILQKNDSESINILNDITCFRNLPDKYSIQCNSNKIQSYQLWYKKTLIEQNNFKYKAPFKFKINANSATIILKNDSAIGQLQQAEGYFDTSLSIRNILYKYMGKNNNYNNCDLTDTMQLLYDVFSQLKGKYLPYGHWKFYRNGKLYAESDIKVSSSLYHVFLSQGDVPHHAPLCADLIMHSQNYWHKIDANKSEKTYIDYYLLPGDNFTFYK